MKTTTATTEQEPVIRHDETVPEQDIESPLANHSAPSAFQASSTNTSEVIFSEYAKLIRIEGWLHGGLND